MSMGKCGYCEVIFDTDADPEGALGFHPWFSCQSCREDGETVAEEYVMTTDPDFVHIDAIQGLTARITNLQVEVQAQHIQREQDKETIANLVLTVERGEKLLAVEQGRRKLHQRYLGEGLAREIILENCLRILGAHATNLKNLYIGGYKEKFMLDAAVLYREIERMCEKYGGERS